MRFDFLRAEGLKHIESLAGKVWTDYNLSDPGISILEVLSYAITDLGYRASYPIKDIIAQDPDAPQIDIKNFYTARQILPMAPVTFNDYRKLLIDTDVHDPADTGAEFVGVKNAWIDISPDNEIHFFIHHATDKLDYTAEIAAAPEQVHPKVLYNVLLELDTCEKFGDLNENTLEGIVTLTPPLLPSSLSVFSGLKVKVNVEFPRWDDPSVDWNDIASIRKNIRNLTLTFPKMPQGYTLEGYGLYPDKTVWISITQLPLIPVTSFAFIENQIMALMYTDPNALIVLYQEKVRKILEIIAAVRARMMANRNLCEDLFTISALKIEEIAVCADIELTADADVEETLAKIYFEIGKFLAPTVYFYTLEEMYDKGNRTEEIFEGPPLNHGFIDNAELENAGRRKVIHVSDLIHIIMEIPGVVAVKSIQIANIPEDNVDNIASVSVRWCLDLAFDHNYVPRLSTDLSKITFYKDLLPFKANSDEVDALLAEMEAEDRPQKIENAVLDLPVPEGEYKNIEEYVSTQDEFPLVYGIGPEGLPEPSTELRKAQAKQLKGFLMFFDQLLADYLSQLFHVKDLFSMNEERDAYGNFIIDKSYFTQSLVPSVTDATSLLTNPTFYAEHVQQITEDPTLFDQRRNKFLDHLMARFSEQFTDYAMLVYKLDGKKAPDDLLRDKLEVLNAYPEISGGRFKGFNYESPCNLWSVDNVSGLEKRASLLTGIDPRIIADLYFNDNFKMTGTIPALEFTIFEDTTPTAAAVLRNNTGISYETVDDWKFAIEKVIINGVQRERYQVLDNLGQVIDAEHPATPGNAPYTYRLVCDKGNILGLSPYLPSTILPVLYLTESDAENAIEDAITAISKEFYNNVESNRNNLTCPIEDYFDFVLLPPDMVPDPPTFTFNFTLYQNPFDFDLTNTQLLTGSYTGKGQAKDSVEIAAVTDTINKKIKLSGNFIGRISVGGKVSIKNSDQNDGDYTVGAITPMGIDTELTLTGGPGALSTSIPLGSLYYNTQTQAELTAFANASINEILFEISLDGIKEKQYTYDAPVLNHYHFNVADRCGDTLATSVEENFNADMAAVTANHPGSNNPVNTNVITIAGNAVPSNNGDHIVANATAMNDTVTVNTADSLTNVAGGTLSFDGSYTVLAANRFTRTFTVNAVLNRVLFPGELIIITGSLLNSGSYTIKNILISGSNSLINVEENIHDSLGTLGSLHYSKTFDVISIVPVTGGTDITFKPGAEVVAAEEMVEFLTEKFFAHEGLHLVEHILLRPKVNTDVFVKMSTGVNSLTTGLTPQGTLEFTKFFPIMSANAAPATNMFFVAGDITADLSPLMTITVKGSAAGINDKDYTVIMVGMTVGMNTGIKVTPQIPDDSIPPGGYGNLYFQMKLPIESASTTSLTVDVHGDLHTEIDKTSPAIITLSQDGKNNGTYKIDTTTVSGLNTTIKFSDVLTHYQDDFLPINLKDDCVNCRIDDPYSFIASVVMPYWQGRFLNQDFRNFFERSLRLECPAHIALNICWVSPDQMKEFELCYKTWIVENSKKVKDLAALSGSLNALIDILVKLRTVYPPGTLHDCEADDTLQNSIILNRTALGTIQI